jgi:hypothetical protein
MPGRGYAFRKDNEGNVYQGYCECEKFPEKLITRGIPEHEISRLSMFRRRNGSRIYTGFRWGKV